MPQAEYTIIKAQRWTFLDELGNPVDGYRVSFVMPNGMVDYVYIPEREYSKDAIIALIKEKVAKHKEVLA